MKSPKIAAFTLLECLVALVVISGSLLVYDGLSRNLRQEVNYLSNQDQGNWLLFAQQLQLELAQSRLDQVANNKLYVTKEGQDLAFSQSKADDFRKTDAHGRGYQPMLYGLSRTTISRQGQLVRIDLTFKSGLERSFYVAFDQAP